MNIESRRTIAVFDFDGTLTKKDTSFAFIGYAAGKAALRWNLLVAVLLAPFDYLVSVRQEMVGPPTERLGNVRGAFEMRFHLRVLRGTLQGRRMADLEQLGRQWAAADMRDFLDEHGLARVAWHLERGHPCYLASASVDLYLTDWAAEVGFAAVLASRLGVRNGQFTGRFDGQPCWGRVKLERLRGLVGELGEYEIYGYGDSPGDRDFLAVCDHPFIARDGCLIPLEETESF